MKKTGAPSTAENLSPAKSKAFYKLTLLMVSGALLLSYQNCAMPLADGFKTDGDSVKKLTADAALQSASMQILSAKCASCHGSGLTTGGVSNITNVDYLISQQLIVPGQPGQSPIITAISSGAMPVGGTAVTADELATLQGWVSSFSGGDPTAPIPSGTPPTLTATFSSIQANILPRCIGCHSPGGARSQTDFSSYSALMASATVVAHNSSASSLYVKVNNQDMPQGGPALWWSEIAAIQMWIDAGAQNN